MSIEKLLKEKLEKYLSKAKPLFENIEVANKQGERFKEMALCYYKDALYFYSKKDYINALAALEYAEGWLDAGIEAGFLVIKSKGED